VSRGPENVTSTTTTELPPFLRGPLEGAVDRSVFQSNSLNPLTANNRQNAGIEALFDRGSAGSPLLNQAQDTTQATLRGDFLDPSTNPFLQGTFNRAADLTRGRLDTEFSGAGRNLGASMPARSEELQTLASNIFGGNFQQERDRQVSAASQAAPLAGADFQNIQAMIDSGSFSVDQLLNRLTSIIPGSGGVTQSTQPVFRTGLF